MMAEENADVQEKIRKLQMLEQELTHLATQRQQLQLQLKESEDALDDLKESKVAYKIIGNVVVASDVEKLNTELKEKKESISLRVASIEKQEKSIKESFDEAQKDVVSNM